MKSNSILGLICGISLIAGGFQALGDEASGTITETGFLSLKLDEKGTIRLFNASAKNTQYAPASWRPEVGDQVKIDYNVTKSRRGDPVLAIATATLTKAGPNSIGEIKSPVTVTIVETGKTGVKAKLPKGQIVKFDYDRGKTEKSPVGWVENVGDQAIITFHSQPNRFTGKVSLVADKVEKNNH